MIQGKSKTASYVSKKLPKSEWTVVENTHEPIISRELFAQVQDIRDKTAGAKESQFSSPATENVFSRKLYCAHCGFTMVRRRYSEKIYGYVCNTMRLYAGGACTGAKISETELKNTLLYMLSAQESKISGILSSMSKENQSKAAVDNELTAVRTELTKNKLFFKGLYESLIDGDITNAEYKEMKMAYEVKIAALTEREKQICEADKKRVRHENVLSKAQTSVRGIRSVSDLTAEVVDRLVERISVYEDKRIEVKFTFMDETIFGDGGADNE